MRKRVLVGVVVVVGIWFAACVASQFAIHPVHGETLDQASAGSQPRCGNVSVRVLFGAQATMCGGVTVFADMPSSAVEPIMPQLSAVGANTSLVYR